jgi:predicted transcriptional regulator
MKVDTNKLITQSAYARELEVTPAAVNKMIHSKRVKTVEIKGATLILLR